MHKKVIFNIFFIVLVLNFFSLKGSIEKQDVTKKQEEDVLQVQDLNEVSIDKDMVFYKNDKWGFIGKKLYDNPRIQVRDRSGRFLYIPLIVLQTKIAQVIFSGLGGVAAAAIINAFFRVGTNRERQDLIEKIGVAFGGAFGFYLILNVSIDDQRNYINFLMKDSYKKALVLYLDNWHLYKEITPEPLTELFELLVVDYKKDSSFISSKCFEIMEVIYNQLIKNDKIYEIKYKEDIKASNILLSQFGLI